MKKAKATKVKSKEKVTGVDKEVQASTYTSKTTFDQVWGKNFSKFKPSDPEEYAVSLAKLTRFDLQQECTKVGLVPHDSREIMTQRLVKECRRAYDANTASSVRPKQVVIKSEAAQRVLNKAAAL